MRQVSVHGVSQDRNALQVAAGARVVRDAREPTTTNNNNSKTQSTEFAPLPFLCRSTQDGSALVNVKGHLVSPAAGNRPQPFTEVFILSQIQVGAPESLKHA